MDELGFNKIAAAVLATALGVMIIRELPHIFMHSDTPETPAYFVGSLEPAASGGAEEVPLPFPQADWVGAMNAEKGAKVFKKCTSCHNADAGGAHGTGPNLYGIVGAAAAGRGDFKYSGALGGAGLTWDFETLDGFLTKPTKYVSGTNMNFIGIKKAEDRAAVIEYLRVASGSPLAQPAPVAAEVMAEDAPADKMIDKVMEKAGDAETMIDSMKKPADAKPVTDAMEKIEKMIPKTGGH